MDYFLSNASLHESEYIFQGVTLLTQRTFLFCLGIIAPQLPDFLPTGTVGLAVRSFEADDFVGSDGLVTQTPHEGALPLKGLLAAWMPSTLSLLHDVLACYYGAGHPESSPRPQPPRASGYHELSVEQLAQLLRDKRVLIFTGAGISLTTGLPDLAVFTAQTRAIFSPIEDYVQDLIHQTLAQRIAQVERYWSLFTDSAPTPAHWAIADLCQTYGSIVVTGNIDRLHEKTGLQPLFYGGGETVDIPDLGGFDCLVTVGLEAGIGRAAEEYRRQNPQGTIIAINPEPPSYLGIHDQYVRGTAAHVLEQWLRFMKPH